jgi:hypothetical protein
LYARLFLGHAPLAREFAGHQLHPNVIIESEIQQGPVHVEHQRIAILWQLVEFG